MAQVALILLCKTTASHLLGFMGRTKCSTGKDWCLGSGGVAVPAGACLAFHRTAQLLLGEESKDYTSGPELSFIDHGTAFQGLIKNPIGKFTKPLLSLRDLRRITETFKQSK